MPEFEYEPLIFSLEPETSYEEEDRGDINGVGPLGTRTTEKELGDFKGGKESPNKEVVSRHALEQILEPKEFVVQDVSYLDYVSTTIEMGEYLPTNEQKIQEI